MRCPSCGRDRPGWNQSCPECGAEPEVALDRLRGMGLRQCAACAYRGEGVPYFRRPAHLVLLLVLAVLTYGIGALVYWLVKRDAVVCPSCGVEWRTEMGSEAVEALSSGRGPANAAPAAAGTGRARRDGGEVGPSGAGGGTGPFPLPADGGIRRVAGVGLLAVAGLIVVLGVADTGSVGAWFVAPAVVGGLGALILWWGRAARRMRRRALLSHLEQKALALARERGGELTASEVATALGLPLPAAERVLLSMDDGLRVRSDVTDEGILLFEFPEFQTRSLPSRETGAG